MKNRIKVVFLTSITTAAVVYVLLEWRPLRTEGARAPSVSWAEPGVPATPVAETTAAIAATVDADEQNNIDIYRKYSEGVVNITSTTVAYDFFYGAYPVEAGTGSGVILDTNGNIGTNYHVIEPSVKVGEVFVTLADKSKLKARIVGTDPNNDLAVIRIDAPKEKLHVIPLGRSAGLLVGQKVLAIGNPFGYERTLTTGIISATGRAIKAENGRVIENIIQTDAAINPGNSGGPLLNRAGEVIGINSIIASPNSGSVGIGFAIPVDTLRRVAGDIITHGYVRRPDIGIDSGVSLGDNPGLSQALGIDSDHGLMIVSLSPAGPAAKAGMRGADRRVIIRNYRIPVGGDVILAINGSEIDSTNDLLTEIDRHKAGDKLTVTVLRGGKQRMDIPVVLQEAPPPVRSSVR